MSEVLNNEIQTLKDQVQCLSESLKTATDWVQAKGKAALPPGLFVKKDLNVGNIFNIMLIYCENVG